MKKRLFCCVVCPALLLLFLAGADSRTAAQEGDSKTVRPDPWDMFRFLVGPWEGTGEGNSGSSRIYVHGEFILGGQYLFLRTKAVFDPQEKNPKGEVHEDWALLSYDKARQTFVLRQFNIEGFVNRFIVESVSDNAKRIVLTTEAVENGPPGLRARITYTKTSDNEFTDEFALAFPGKDFAVYGTSRLKRKH